MSKRSSADTLQIQAAVPSSHRTSLSANGVGQRRLVLSEEDYTSTLSTIVQRDYFPQINELERQNALLECRLRGDVAGAVAVRRATRRLMGHEDAMEAQRLKDDEDVITLENGNKTCIRKRPRPLSEETLTGFHARVTNEDNEEFDSNLRQEIQSHREHLEQVFHSQATAATSTKNSVTNSFQRLTNGKDLLDEMASDDFCPESNRISVIDWKRPPMKNELFFNPTPLRGASASQYALQQRSVEDHSKLLLTNGAADGGTKDIALEPHIPHHASNNPLMLPPTPSQTRTISVRSNKMTSNATPAVPQSQLVEYIPKYNLEKKIDPSQTRFPSRSSIIPVPGRGVLHSTSTSTGLLDASDTEDSESYATDASTLYSTDLDAPLRPLEQERQRRNRRNQKQQQQQDRSYVAMTPQIIPGVAGNASPITTWGTIEQTPLIISGRDPGSEFTNDDGTSSFMLPAQSQREEAARHAEMALAKRAKLAKATVTKASKSRKSATVSASRKMSPALTPGGVSLLQKRGKVSSRSGDAFGSALRNSYSQSRPSQTRSSNNRLERSGRSSKRSQRDHAYNATPQL
ncbi:nuclear protein Es2 [Nitzschia inconspicua]|uniref:Nuclear protein Es2 n=1 Tax=Nitzschia inconspicua TaxID=303405 RepID=A0A9K3PDT8_9STRA|nr:nuclear protein Es2 [Nitzschia inconspicua]